MGWWWKMLGMWWEMLVKVGIIMGNVGKVMGNAGKSWDNDGKVMGNVGKSWDNDGKYWESDGKCWDNWDNKKQLFWLFYTFYYLINLFRHIIGESEEKNLISYEMAKVAYFDLFWKPYMQSLPNLVLW